ncbi:serine hydrolase domain-containing protein [Oryzobacter sp. R7]|uniref:serine hydrolase domain-containing protein n=1 Tax=Oryzobacter faecalis TaxID=3388656 RepID=UPI00398CE88D
MSDAGEDAALVDAVEAVVSSTTFSGAVRVDRAGTTLLDAAYGLADRRHGVAATPATRFGIASGTKGLTALAVLSLVADGTLSLDTRVRDLLGSDLPLVDGAVTVEHLLSHHSGIGDYVDEEAVPEVTDHVLRVPVHTLTTAEDYLAVLDGLPQVSPPGERFTYNNSGFVVLAIVAGRAARVTFEDLVLDRVCGPAGMGATAFLRSDELPGDAATGYLWADRPRTNVLHLPVVGSGDGGAYTTTADVLALWRAFFAGAVVPMSLMEDAMTSRATTESGSRYGLGFWLGAEDGVAGLVGSDAGVSFRTVHDRRADLTWTVVSNTSEGAWPVARALAASLAGPQA